MAKKMTLDEFARKMSHEGGVDGMVDWGGTDAVTNDKKFNEIWKKCVEIVNAVREYLPESDE